MGGSVESYYDDLEDVRLYKEKVNKLLTSWFEEHNLIEFAIFKELINKNDPIAYDLEKWVRSYCSDQSKKKQDPRIATIEEYFYIKYRRMAQKEINSFLSLVEDYEKVKGKLV